MTRENSSSECLKQLLCKFIKAGYRQKDVVLTMVRLGPLADTILMLKSCVVIRTGQEFLDHKIQVTCKSAEEASKYEIFLLWQWCKKLLDLHNHARSAGNWDANKRYEWNRLKGRVKESFWPIHVDWLSLKENLYEESLPDMFSVIRKSLVSRKWSNLHCGPADVGFEYCLRPLGGDRLRHVDTVYVCALFFACLFEDAEDHVDGML